MLTKKKEKIEHAMCVENKAIWPRIAGRNRERKNG